MDTFVYHSSSKSGLKLLKPAMSSHGNEWLYATKDKLMSLVFLKRKIGIPGDYIYWKGRNPYTGKVTIVERYHNAFRDIFNDVSGSIYVLPADSFEQKTGWPEEVISEKPITPSEEIIIDNIWDYILNLHNAGEMEVYFYPDRPNMVPKDDVDLQRRAEDRLKKHGLKSIEFIKKINPELYKKLKIGI